MNSSSENKTPDFALILASAVHDMKNSLGMLLNSLDQLCDRLPAADEQGVSATTIRYEAERLNNDLIQLLGVYRLRNDKLSAISDEVFVEEMFDEISAQYEPLFEARKIKFSAECDADLCWYLDREMVSGIINNAINNASRYTSTAILLEAKMVVIDGIEYLQLSVNDDGKGYPQNILEIEPSDILNNLNFKTGSTSLGLYFASSVAGLHEQNGKKGFIELANGGPLGGGYFKLLLP